MWPRYDIPEIWQQIEERGVAQKPGSDTLVGRPIVESLRDTDLGTKAFVLRVPLLVCHGTADSRIDISHSRELAARVPPGQTFRYTEYDGASHSFRPPEIHWEPLSQEFTTWLQDINNNPTTLHH